jgi:adenylate kinase
MLRELRLEFMGQTTIVPDTPQVRKRLWRVRHIVRVDHLDLDEAKALIGVPEHVSFRDLAAQIPTTFGRTRAVATPQLRSKMNFMQLRRMRLRDVMHRDQLEKKLLEEKRRALQKSAAEAGGKT